MRKKRWSRLSGSARERCFGIAHRRLARGSVEHAVRDVVRRMHPALDLDERSPRLAQVFGEDHARAPGARLVGPRIAESAPLDQVALAIEEIDAAHEQVVLAHVNAPDPVAGCEAHRLVLGRRAQHVVRHPVEVLAVFQHVDVVPRLFAFEIGDREIGAEHRTRRIRTVPPAALGVAGNVYRRTAQFRGRLEHKQALAAACVTAFVIAGGPHRVLSQPVAEDQCLLLVDIIRGSMPPDRILDEFAAGLRPRV